MRLRTADRGPGYTYRPDTGPPSIYGEHQPGIVTPRLDHLVLAAFDLDRPVDPRVAAWAAAAERAMARDRTTGSFPFAVPGLARPGFAGARRPGDVPAT